MAVQNISAVYRVRALDNTFVLTVVLAWENRHHSSLVTCSSLFESVVLGCIHVIV